MASNNEIWVLTREREGDRERGRGRERQGETERERQKERDRDRKKERESEWVRERERQIETERKREIEIEREKERYRLDRYFGAILFFQYALRIDLQHILWYYLFSCEFPTLFYFTVDDDLKRVGCGVKGNILVRGPPCFGGESCCPLFSIFHFLFILLSFYLFIFLSFFLSCILLSS